MSRITSIAIGMTAAAMALGGVHLDVAASRDGGDAVRSDDVPQFVAARSSDDAIAMRWPVNGNFAEQAVTIPAVVVHVDRSAKSHREAAAVLPGGLTLSFMLPEMSATSILMRIPPGEMADALRRAPAVTQGSQETSRGPSSRPASAGPRPVACEPVVSVLTAVAKQLEAGRCVT